MEDPILADPVEILLESPLPEPVAPCLVLHTTEQCNAKCDHCIVWAGPARRGRLDCAVAMAAIRGATRVQGLETVVFSGGETFLDVDGLLALCREARRLGLRTRVVTNGFWAQSAERAARMLERLAQDGVDQLAISFDEFHAPWIEPRLVKNVYLGARQARTLPYLLFSAVIPPVDLTRGIVVSRTGIPWPSAVVDLLGSYGFSLEECVPRDIVRAQACRLDETAQREFREAVIRNRVLVHWNALSVGGRATREIISQFPSRSIESDTWGGCAVAGSQLTVTTSGRLYPCCSVWSNARDHHFGVVADADGFFDQAKEMTDDPVVRTIREVGPAAIARQLRGEGVSLPEHCHDLCHCCENLLAAVPMPGLRAAAARCMETQP